MEKSRIKNDYSLVPRWAGNKTKIVTHSRFSSTCALVTHGRFSSTCALILHVPVCSCCSLGTWLEITLAPTSVLFWSCTARAISLIQRIFCVINIEQQTTVKHHSCYIKPNDLELEIFGWVSTSPTSVLFSKTVSGPVENNLRQLYSLWDFWHRKNCLPLVFP